MASKVNNINLLDADAIDSDNSTTQYKSAKHFNNLQKLSNRLDKNIIHLYEVAGHGNGEVISHWKVQQSGNVQIFEITSLALLTF